MLKWQYFGYIGFKLIKINLCFFFAFFLMWHIFKVFVGFVTVLLLFYALVFWPWVMWDPSSPTRDWTHTPYMGRWSLNHWTAMKVPFLFLFTRGPSKVKTKGRRQLNRQQWLLRSQTSDGEGGMDFTGLITLNPTLHWVGWCPPKIHAHLEPQNVTLLK